MLSTQTQTRPPARRLADPASVLLTQVTLATGEFLERVVALSRRAVMTGLASAVGATSDAIHGTYASPGSRTSPSPKRPPAQIEALTRRFALFVRDNPGLRIEQINKQLGTTTAELLLPIRRLLADGALSTQGSRRSTKYLPGPHFVRRVLDAARPDLPTPSAPAVDAPAPTSSPESSSATAAAPKASTLRRGRKRAASAGGARRKKRAS